MERASLSQKTNIFQNSKILYGLRLTEIHILASMSNKRKGIGFGIVWFRDKYKYTSSSKHLKLYYLHYFSLHILQHFCVCVLLLIHLLFPLFIFSIKLPTISDCAPSQINAKVCPFYYSYPMHHFISLRICMDS